MKFFIFYASMASMEQLQSLPIIQLISQFSYGAVFVISLLANIFIPIPEEITILFLGYLTGIGKLSFVITFFVIITGLFISDSALYFLAKKGNRFVESIYDKIFATRFGGNTDFINRHIGKIIFTSRFLVQLRFIGPYLAGHKKIPFKQFFFYDMSAIMLDVGIFLVLGNVLYKKIELVINGVVRVQRFIVLLIVIWLGYTLLKLFLKTSFWQTIKQSFE